MIQAELIANSKTDTLKFTSGIRAIFQDNHENYWFGSLQEGVAVFRDSAFVYYTKKDGLTHDFALSIFTGICHGLLWLGMADGNVYTFDGKTFNKQF